MIDWTLDTLLWTGILIAAVLVLRGPFARTFGPRSAYALWLLPTGRLFLPQIALPTAPVPVMVSGSSVLEAEVPSSAATIAVAAIGLWLVGAGLTLCWRLASYLRMRRQLLASAQNIRHVGRVRIVETPFAAGPLALGVLDPIIALPSGFADRADPLTLDLTITHELTHHRGGDLLLNFLVQPLFALHWFNPLGHLGWHALRHDQEAACDARVLAGRDAAQRSAYAALIATYATAPAFGPAYAGAAAMACPMLGTPSIVHRLRSLAIADLSLRRRRSGIGVLVAFGCAVPLTATISYAAVPAQATPSSDTNSTPTKTVASPQSVTSPPGRVPPRSPPMPNSVSAHPARPKEVTVISGQWIPAHGSRGADQSRFDELSADARARMDVARDRLTETGDQLAKLEFPNSATVDAIAAKAKAAIATVRAGEAANNASARTGFVYRELKNGKVVATIDCKAFQEGQAYVGDPIAKRVCSGSVIGATGTLNIARSLIAGNAAISKERKVELLAGVDGAIAETNHAAK